MLSLLLLFLLQQEAPLQPAWAADADDYILGTPAIHGNLVLAASKRGTIFAHKLDTGDKEWSVSVGGDVISHLTLFKDRLFVPAGGHSAVLDPLTGKILKEEGPPAARAVVGEKQLYLLRDVFFEGKYRIAFSDDVVAYDPVTGREAWKEAYSRLGVSTVVESGARLYVASQYHLHAADVKKGKVVGESKRDNPGLAYFGAADRNRIIFIQGSGVGLFKTVVSYNPSSLKEQWNWKAAGSEDAHFLPPLLDPSKLIVFPLPKVVALDAKTGAELWTVTLEGAPTYSTSPPALKGTDLCVAAGGKLFGVDVATGKGTWTLASEKFDLRWPVPQPAWAGDRLVFANGRKLVCYKPK